MPDLEAPGAWTILHRLPPDATRHLTLPAHIGHIFGDSASFSECHVILAYDAGGGMSHLCLRDGDSWDCVELAVEVTCKPIRKPSVRLVFRSDIARRSFLDCVLRGKEAMYGLVEEPRLVEVWNMPEGV